MQSDYNINPMPLEIFVTDNKITLPRFQRKPTWKDIDRFKLALSIFKNYPCGCVILSKEKNDVRWLLDGRQRRDTLSTIFLNPFLMAKWSKKCLKLSKSPTELEITKKFIEAVSEYMESNDDEEEKLKSMETFDSSSLDDEIEDNDENEDYNEDFVNNSNDDEDTTKNNMGDLEVLLKLITIGILDADTAQGSCAGVCSIFDLKKYFKNCKPFLKQLYKDDGKKVDPQKLRNFIVRYKDRYISNLEYKKASNFIDFLEENFQIEDDQKNKLRSTIETLWDSKYLVVIDCVIRINELFKNLTIGCIEIKGFNPSDAKKIFGIINTSGTKLTASEILSAKQSWNYPINVDADYKLKGAIDKLYDSLSLGSRTESPVRWDVLASLSYYLQDSTKKTGFDYIFDLPYEEVPTPDSTSKRITLGFKLYSACYHSGIKNTDIDKLSKDIKWEEIIEKIMNIKKFFGVLENDEFLKTLVSWDKPLSKVLADGPALNYLGVLFRKWEDSGSPVGVDSADMKKFKKNSFILLDKMVYEYVTSQWKGSGDSIIANNIKNYKKDNSLFNEQPSDDWTNVLKEYFNKNTILNKVVTSDKRNAILFWMNCILKIKGDNSLNIDHIIPKAAWESSAIKDGQGNNFEVIREMIFNMSPLTEKLNKAKKDQSLLTIKNNHPDLVDEIAKYELLDKNKFDVYSEINNYKVLKEDREKAILDCFDKERVKIINNS